MKTSERLKQLAALHEAQDAGKTTQYWHLYDGWVDRRIEAISLNEFLPHCWRVKPDEPAKPSQEWLDKHGVELTGECRVAVDGELTHSVDFGTANARYDLGPMIITTIQGVECCPRWILRRKQPEYVPWTIEEWNERVGTVVQSTNPTNKCRFVITQTNGTCIWIGGQLSGFYPDQAFAGFEQLDGSPCGRRVT